MNHLPTQMQINVLFSHQWYMGKLRRHRVMPRGYVSNTHKIKFDIVSCINPIDKRYIYILKRYDRNWFSLVCVHLNFAIQSTGELILVLLPRRRVTHRRLLEPWMGPHEGPTSRRCRSCWTSSAVHPRWLCAPLRRRWHLGNLVWCFNGNPEVLKRYLMVMLLY